MELLPFWLLADVADVLAFGAEKYSAWNWVKGHPPSVLVGCILRHLTAIQAGEAIDPESKEYHIDHIIANALMLAHSTKYRPHLRDFPEDVMIPVPDETWRPETMFAAKAPPADIDGEPGEWEK